MAAMKADLASLPDDANQLKEMVASYHLDLQKVRNRSTTCKSVSGFYKMSYSAEGVKNATRKITGSCQFSPL